MGGKRQGAGPRAIKIDVSEMEKLCTLQATDEELAAWFGVSARTIERRRNSKAAFAEAMERGKAKGRLSLRRSLWALAAKGNPAREYLAKNLLGCRDYFRNEHSGPDGAPIAVKQDLSRLTDEELEQFDKILLRLDPNGNADGRQYLWKLDRWGRSVAHCVRSIQ